MTTTDAFGAFLKFEWEVFREPLPIPTYDPFLIRYGEYRFTLDRLSFAPGEDVLDLGCESGIFGVYVASLGASVIGVDINPHVWRDLERRKRHVESVTSRNLALSFEAQDATDLRLPANSIDKIIAISSIEHMFSKRGCGDQLAIDSLARVLKPGGDIVLTVPMSNGGAFHESATGDAGYHLPYRLYTPEMLQERILSRPGMEVANVSYLAQTTPDPRFPDLRFFRFWMETLTAAERAKWAWANPILANTFNPIITPEEALGRLGTVNTALVHLRKIG